MTKEEIENNYTYRIVKRALIRELPFIKDIILNDEDIDKYKSTLFFDLIIDPYEMAGHYNTKVWDLIDKKLKRGEGYDSIAPSIFLDEPKRFETGQEITDDIVNIVKQIQSASVVPDELKLKKRLYPSSFIVKPL